MTFREGAVRATGGEGARSVNTNQAFIALATYFAEVKGLASFATQMVETIRDDRRLQAAAPRSGVLVGEQTPEGLLYRGRVGSGIAGATSTGARVATDETGAVYGDFSDLDVIKRMMKFDLHPRDIAQVDRQPVMHADHEFAHRLRGL